MTSTTQRRCGMVGQSLIWMGLMAALMVLTGVLGPAPARAEALVPAVQYTGSTNAAISFGATNYGGAGEANPVWLSNNITTPITGVDDILASPGHGYLLADPVVGNNVASTGGPPGLNIPVGNTLFLNWTGGLSPQDNAPFGSGRATIYGPAATFGLTDATPGGGGTASYGIESWISNYTINQHVTGTFGTFLAISGSIGVGNNAAAVAALQTEVLATGPGGGAPVQYTFGPLILAAANTPGGLNNVAVYDANGIAGSGAAISVDASGDFNGLAINDYAADFAAGTTLSVVSTLTFYADPASLEASTPDLSLIPGGKLPDFAFGSVSVPEPSSIVLGGTAMLALSLIGGIRRRTRRTG